MASPSRHDYQFGGPLGALALSTLLPLLLYLSFLTCNDKSGCPAPALLDLHTLSWQKLRAQIPWHEDGIKGLANWKVTCWVAAYYLFSLLLYRILPAQKVHGTKLRGFERPLEYRFNAFSATVVQLFIVIIGTWLHGANFTVWTFIDNNYVQILTANLILAYAIASFVYIRSFGVKPGNSKMRQLAQGGCTGNMIYDWFIGRELNPRLTVPFIGEVDIKAALMMRPGLTGWLLLDLAFLAKQYRLYGYVSDSIVFTTIIQSYYVLEGQYAEAGIVSMMDITTDGLGFMLTFGDIVWVPFLYSTQCRYLSVYPVHLGWLRLATVSIVFALGLYIFRASNAQKIAFRTNPDHPRFVGLPYIQTKKGTRLLVGGWWGMARHINYFGDWLQAIPFSLPTGLAGYVILTANSVVPNTTNATHMTDGRVVVQGDARGWGTIYTYLYVVYFAVLLIHRERRDSAACAEKYGEDWDEYKRTVPWRILPGVY
ncbi:putative C-14 sterol reductase [Talaromyces proteolyticus]|uniref:Delta(14)-sterol reductase n=1 Tax=Talaromyces proteolyticus TaxID=1131652 RepID=A0AAD4KEA5_9EURO|nr:putative C-14 sterol reductase [Talaromyces proteolyticus]KAH8690197.1 putative C-14 sterol reductase [Talaromyces proteolyticus]